MCTPLQNMRASVYARTHTQTHTDNTDTHTDTHTQTHTQRERDKQTHRHTHRHTHTHATKPNVPNVQHLEGIPVHRLPVCRRTVLLHSCRYYCLLINIISIMYFYKLCRYYCLLVNIISIVHSYNASEANTPVNTCSPVSGSVKSDLSGRT